jgi:hypothetical protein
MMGTERDLLSEIAELTRERDALLEQINGDPELSLYFYQRKAIRQRVALDRLNRRVVSQRLILRELERLGRGLTREEYLAAREAVENPQLRERIEEQQPVLA